MSSHIIMKTMSHDVKLLKRYLHQEVGNINILADYMSLTHTRSIYNWTTSGKIPKTKRHFILKFLKEKLK